MNTSLFVCIKAVILILNEKFLRNLLHDVSPIVECFDSFSTLIVRIVPIKRLSKCQFFDDDILADEISSCLLRLINHVHHSGNAKTNKTSMLSNGNVDLRVLAVETDEYRRESYSISTSDS